MRPVVLCISRRLGLSPRATRMRWRSAARRPSTGYGPPARTRSLRRTAADVGLPEGGRYSEVGHTNIGAGRVVWMDLPRIDNAVAESAASPRVHRGR